MGVSVNDWLFQLEFSVNTNEGCGRRTGPGPWSQGCCFEAGGGRGNPIVAPHRRRLGAVGGLLLFEGERELEAVPEGGRVLRPALSGEVI